MTKQEVYLRITDYISKRGELEGIRIHETDNLLEHGYVDSLTLVDMIAFLEELVGHEIIIENYELRNFYTLESIYATFFQEDNIS